MPSGTTSFPIPSPAITAMLNIFIGCVSPSLCGEKRRERRHAGGSFQCADERNYLFSLVSWPIRILRAATELRRGFIEGHRICRAALAKGGTPRDHLAVFKSNFQDRSHFVEACAFGL